MISFLLLKKYHLILRQRGTVFELIEKSTGNTVGVLDYSCHYGKHGEDFPTINLFMIFDRKYRNCGLGKVLMNAAKKYFRSHGIDTIYTIPRPEKTDDGYLIPMDVLIERYVSYGFHDTGEKCDRLSVYACPIAKWNLIPFIKK